MIDKTLATCKAAVASVFDGATLMFGGFGNAGMPGQLIEALRAKGLRDLVIISNGAGTGNFALGALFGDGCARKWIGSFPSPSAAQFRDRYLKGEIELELVPQGTLVERIRSAGASLGGFCSKSLSRQTLPSSRRIAATGSAIWSIGARCVISI